ARTEVLAIPAEVRVDAELPRALTDFGRTSAIVETRDVEVGERRIQRIPAPRQVGSLVQHDGTSRSATPAPASGVTAAPTDLAQRGHAVVQSHRPERRVVAWVERDAAAAEIGVGADEPAAAPHHRRRREVIAT